jgi:hypothetical protein
VHQIRNEGPGGVREFSGLSLLMNRLLDIALIAALLSLPWAEIKRGDRILTVKPFSLGRIQIASPFISYADMSIKVSDPNARATPTVTGLLPTDSYSFEKYSDIWYGCPQTSTTPPTYGQDGYVDAVSGAARPIAITAGSYCIPVAIVVTRNGQTAKFPNQLMAKIQ